MSNSGMGRDVHSLTLSTQHFPPSSRVLSSVPDLCPEGLLWRGCHDNDTTAENNTTLIISNINPIAVRKCMFVVSVEFTH